MDKPNKQICMLKILFSVDSDDEAIEYKKKIAAIVMGLPEVQIDFRLMNAPPPPQNQSNGSIR